jgi:glycine dehydrogenase subunit 1
MEVGNLMQERAMQTPNNLCFIGAGAYEHHIPAAVWDIVSRGEFYSAYTPYQAEASQGTLQLLYEFQTMIANLTGMDVANASLYDGASALAEALLMTVRSSQFKKVLLPKSLHPYYRKVAQTFLEQQSIAWQEIPYDAKTGTTALESLKDFTHDFAALVIPQPNFFGQLEPVDELTQWAQQHNVLTIAVVNPIAIALLKEPGSWGEKGVDIVCGEGQPLGIPLASGGPYMGFLACKKNLVRQMPGRIVGRTSDSNGKEAFTLTLQAREQHIRRSKATSNICTNQTLLVTAATIYMSLLGAEGLRRVAAASHNNAIDLRNRLLTIEGIQQVFTAPNFHEFVIRLNQPVNKVLEKLAEENIQGGFALENDYPELKNCLLVCATETKSKKDLQEYQEKLTNIMSVPAHA